MAQLAIGESVCHGVKAKLIGVTGQEPNYFEEEGMLNPRIGYRRGFFEVSNHLVDEVRYYRVDVDVYKK